MSSIKVKKEWDDNQLNAFYLSSLVILFDLVYDKNKIREIFITGGLNFSPTDSQINNWRKTKKHSPIFRDEYLKCFINGLFILKKIEKIDVVKPNKLDFFYNILIKLFGVKPDNLPDDERERLGELITFLLEYKTKNNSVFRV